MIQSNEDFLKNYNKKSDEGYHFYLKEWRLKKVEKLLANFHDKTKYFIHLNNLK